MIQIWLAVVCCSLLVCASGKIMTVSVFVIRCTWVGAHSHTVSWQRCAFSHDSEEEKKVRSIPELRTVMPVLTLLGTAQDGGVPQAGCSCQRYSCCFIAGGS